MLSKDGISTGSDLSLASSSSGSSNWDGPSILLLNTNNSDFGLSSGSTALSFNVTRSTGSNADGYSLVIKESQGSIKKISFDIDGNLTDQETLSSDQVTDLEVSLQTDLNSDGTAGVYVNNEVFNRYSGSGDSSDKRNLYTTNTGNLLLSRDGVSTGSDLSSACLLYTSPSPRDLSTSRMPSSA